MNVGKWLGLTTVGAALVVGLACSRPAPAPGPAPVRMAPGGIEGWERSHPEASRALGAWVHQFPQSAGRFFQWDSHHTERAHEFVTWSIRHPRLEIRAFAETHRGWEEFDVIARQHQPAANAFMAWCRRYPEAAEALMNHPRGLAWAGDHLYRGAWR